LAQASGCDWLLVALRERKVDGWFGMRDLEGIDMRRGEM
jgi:hypothetical protein